MFYHDDAEMQNGGNGEEGSGQLIPRVVHPDVVEEIGTLEPQRTMEGLPVQYQAPEQPRSLFDGSRIFIQAPQYHWHVATSEGSQTVDQEARDRIVALADLLDRFGRRTEMREEELWERSGQAAESAEVVRLVEPLTAKIGQLEERVTLLEQKVNVVEALSLDNQEQQMKNRSEVNGHLGLLQANVTKCNHRLEVLETVTKNWNKMQQELAIVNTEVAAIRSAQTGLHSLMEKLAKQIEELTSGQTTQDEPSAVFDERSEGAPLQTIWETGPEEEESTRTMDRVLEDQPKTFTWGASAAPSSSTVLGTPVYNPPVSMQQKQVPVPTIVPQVAQRIEKDTTFKEYVEQTIAKMRTPQTISIEKSQFATPSQSVQTGSFGTMGVGMADQSMVATATSATAIPQQDRIGGLKLEMPEKFTGSRIPAIAGWLTKMERYFRLMKYPSDIWVDVIATRVTDAAQAWLDKTLQDLQLGRRNPWASWAEFRQEMEAAFTPMSEVEQARRKLMEIRMGRNVSSYIQQFRTLMYKVPEMTQEEAFSLFMRGLEPRIREQIGYHVEGDLGRAMAMAEKADVWRSRGDGKDKGQNQNKQKAGGSGQQGQGQNWKTNKKPGWGKKGSGSAVQGKGTVPTGTASGSGSIAAVDSGTNTGGQQNINQKQQKKGSRRKFSCPGCGGKHQFKDCPQWKSVQALLAKDKKSGN